MSNQYRKDLEAGKRRTIEVNIAFVELAKKLIDFEREHGISSVEMAHQVMWNDAEGFDEWLDTAYHYLRTVVVRRFAADG